MSITKRIPQSYPSHALRPLAPRHVPTKNLRHSRQRNWAGESAKNAPLITLYHLAIYVRLDCTPNQVRPQGLIEKTIFVF